MNSKENINNVNIRNIINTKIKSLDSRINTLDQEGENGIKEKKERIIIKKKKRKQWITKNIAHKARKIVNVGHVMKYYANECPNKKYYKKEVKYLNPINSIGLVSYQ